MDVHIGEMSSNLRVVDDQTLVSPRVMQQIIAATLARLRQEEQRATSLEEGRQLRPSASAQRASEWQ